MNNSLQNTSIFKSEYRPPSVGVKATFNIWLKNDELFDDFTIVGMPGGEVFISASINGKNFTKTASGKPMMRLVSDAIAARPFIVEFLTK